MPRLVLRVNYGGAKVWRALHYVTKHKDGKRVSILTTYKPGGLSASQVERRA
jgi:hypothetical protein